VLVLHFAAATTRGFAERQISCWLDRQQKRGKERMTLGNGKLSRKRALQTGASSGIGAAIAKA
jgi:hypothetical protein